MGVGFSICTGFSIGGGFAENARAIAELRTFDDLLLKDLGIKRRDIPAYVDGEMASQPKPELRLVVSNSCPKRPACCSFAA